MVEKVHVIPGAGRLVLLPGGRKVPVEGVICPLTTFIQRRINCGDLVVVPAAVVTAGTVASGSVISGGTVEPLPAEISGAAVEPAAEASGTAPAESLATKAAKKGA